MDSLTALNQFRAQVEIFVPLTEAEWQVLKSYLEIIVLKKKKNLAEPGKVCNYLTLVAKGAVRYFHIKDGEEITGYFSFENEFASSYKSFLTRQSAINYVQALEDTILVSFSYNNLQQAYADELIGHKMERMCRLIAEHYLICCEDRIASFVTQTPEERYNKLLETGGEVLQRIPQHYVANFLGITPVSLSRIRRRIMKISA
ncbi:cAMP-binding domain of CRP or a regulatory subunit of cAMP-dependent protein kinases [Mucilaginibacter lappiensis]|uniref:Signal-transduction protein with cAMP-binding, CBS, and nucleotidyltransferase domain n=1 Tax=Mucilaginibacter lappiensis TaxID=354630 RepID=A0ABR6PLQ3_9SPHI|nr:Crp/Fnr family transcriptional regulator [Mucilaginibacter lappiensis]MBB6110705.1 signal-transduction protein with cAMP-binding, CBS, and nucleotidyltransferase domain [Mucilaginibacter lappiensis]SIR46152.1 cAMP-binding domain of CRP or a regulatory subunit of cAMP-dependent protein kinases [Mucilaginibacter lappiensis]